MTWADLTRDWPTAYATLKQHFPNLDDGAIAHLKQDQDHFASYLAARHALTQAEAREALDDFLLVQTLWRDKLAQPNHA